jgi:hypothetical protein
MMTRRFITTLLISLLAFSGATHALASPRDDGNEAITPEEERETRAVAEQFVGRFRITNDLAPVLRELAVEDYDERLRQNFTGEFDLLGREATSEANPREVSDFFTALLNLISLSTEQAERDRKTTNEGDGGDDTIEDLYPPDVTNIIEGNPELESFLSQLMGIKSAERKAVDQQETKGELKETQAYNDKADGAIIKTIEQLRHWTVDANRIVDRLRDHLATLPPKPLEESDRSAPSEDETFGTARVTVLEGKFFGYPIGTKLICINVTPISDGATFHLCLIKVDGRLQILALSPVLDSD